MKLSRSKTLPCPPVILAIISLPQRIKPVIKPARINTIIIMVIIITLRFLDLGFLALIFGEDLVVEGSAALSSPVVSSKLKAWTGFRKSSTELV